MNCSRDAGGGAVQPRISGVCCVHDALGTRAGVVRGIFSPRALRVIRSVCVAVSSRTEHIPACCTVLVVLICRIYPWRFAWWRAVGMLSAVAEKGARLLFLYYYL